ncbi:MAG: FAD-dependent oxidoreductase [Candidatus Cloacimonetes bacterium]|nr:FAD-dependent oxidoreductase [Candidatus Cloacimonadota bacterium]
MIRVKLNGKDVFAQPGRTILDVCQTNGVHVPTLCHDPELQPYGSCWVCAVEVKGARGFVTACGTKVMDGMEIITDSTGVHIARKMALELLLSDHYADCEAPCKVACPASVDVQAYVAYVANGQYHEATRTIKQTLPMPLSIGRVCPAFCEHECRRNIVDDPIAIRHLKRHCSDFDLNDEWQWEPERKPHTGKRIAIVGGGPSGLTAGYYLSYEGHEVTVFESAPKAGGWLRYGIPEYRLPKDILDREIEIMCRGGMEIKTGAPVGDDITIVQLCADYDAVYLAMGAQKAVPMRVQGAELDGVLLGVDFLRDHALGNKPEVGARLAIIGGGNTAVDCARTGKRLGADVTIVYRRTRAEMPAEEFEVDASDEEGIRFYMLTNPVEFMGESGKLTKVRFEKMELGEPDSSGRRRPMPTGEYFEEEFDTVIAAISQAPDVEFLSREENHIAGAALPLTRWDTADVDENTMYSGMGNVFAGGDFRRGPATAVEAIADGARAFYTIDRFLRGLPVEAPARRFDSKKEAKLKDISPEEFAQYVKEAQHKMPELDAKIRMHNFEEVETGYADADARAEAQRCIECGCQDNEHCALRDYGTQYDVNLEQLAGERNKHPIDHTHPFIQRDANRCINCGRCVRICAETQGPGVLGYIFRGFQAVVAPEFGESLTLTACESCGKCVAVCPVGALTEKQHHYKLSPLGGEKFVQNCGLCGTGCAVEIETQSDRVSIIRTPEPEDFNLRNLCFKGRFGWQTFDDEDRLTSPLVKRDGAWVAIEWNEAAEMLKQKIAEAGKKRFSVSADSTNEEILLVREAAANAHAELSSLSLQPSFVDALSYSPKSFDELAQAEAIVIVGGISHTLRTLARHHQRNGARLIVIDSEETAFNQFADRLLNDSDYHSTLERLRKHHCNSDICECDCGDIEALPIDLPNRTLFLYSRNFVGEQTARDIWLLATVVCDFVSGSGVMPTSEWSNLSGLVRAGVCAGDPAPADFTLVWGESPQPAQVKDSGFVVAVQTHLDPGSLANLLLPQPTYLEIDGSAFTDDGRFVPYRNVRGSALFDSLIEMLSQAGLLSCAQYEVAYWQGMARSLQPATPVCSVNPQALQKLLDTLDPADDKPMQMNAQKTERLDKLKELTKK